MVSPFSVSLARTKGMQQNFVTARNSSIVFARFSCAKPVPIPDSFETCAKAYSYYAFAGHGVYVLNNNKFI